MSKFSSAKAFKNIGKSCSIPITTKISQKELKKQKQKQSNKNSDLCVSDAEFEAMMDQTHILGSDKKKTMWKIPESTDITPQVTNIINKGILGEKLCMDLKSGFPTISGVELLNGLFDKHPDPNDISWIQPQEYGMGLKELNDNNLQSQIQCLLLAQRFCEQNNFTKILYKNNSVYLIKILFQLFFTYGIVDEEAYWGWQDYIDNDNSDIVGVETKQTLLIQTNDFFMILKTVFEEDEFKNDSNPDDIQEISNPNRQNKQEQLENQNLDNSNSKLNTKLNTKLKSHSQSESDSDSDDVFKVPKEQDYNLDDL